MHVDFTLIDFSIETDGNLAWIERAAYLGYDNLDQTYFVQYGALDGKLNVEFKDVVKIPSDIPIQCFNVIALSEGMHLVDCQALNETVSTLYIIDE